jgi:hypothetical protein
MDDPFTFADLLTWFSPLLVPLWLWGLWRVRQDFGCASPRRADVARCGLPRGPIGPSPLAQLIRRRTRFASGPRTA